jgi:anti-sigma factor RsiW
MAMMNEQPDELSERDEIEALLPWYVSGKLDVHARARVERYVKAHPEVSAHLALVREESDATITANEAIRAPGPQALDRLRASIAAAPRRQPLGAAFGDSPIGSAIGSQVSPPPQLALAAAVAALLVMLQAAHRRIGLGARGALTHQTAAASRPLARASSSWWVPDTATIGEVAALRARLDAVVVDGPESRALSPALAGHRRRGPQGPPLRLCISRGW